MLRSVKELRGFAVSAQDGEVGKVKDAYFDDDSWAVRYLVVDTGEWLSSRQVLISPMSVRGLDWENALVRVGLTRQQVEDSPQVDTDKPVSRQYEVSFYGYYGYPYYWGGPFLWGTAPYPVLTPPKQEEVAAREAREREAREHASADPHLRSAKAVIGYHVQATDEAIGHVEDLIFDEQNWAIRYAVVDTRNWWPGKHVLIPPQWFTRIEWTQSRVHVDVTRQAVESSPEWDASAPPSRDYESAYYRHFSRDGYWDAP